MSDRRTNVAVAVVALALAGGGVFIGLRGLSDDDIAAPESVPIATLPPVTVAPPAPAVIETLPTGSDGTDPTDATVDPTDATADDGLLPVPNVLGVSEAVARSRLDDFEVEITRVSTLDPEDFDEVTAQEPAAASRLEAGGTVRVVFSARPRPETIEVEPFPAGEFDSVDVDQLEPGGCGVRRLDDRVLFFDPVDCAEPHDVQLIERIQLQDAPAEYDESAFARLTEDQCEPVFERFVGIELADSELRLYSLRPSPARFDAGDTTAACAVRTFDGIQLIGSAEDSYW